VTGPGLRLSPRLCPDVSGRGRGRRSLFDANLALLSGGGGVESGPPRRRNWTGVEPKSMDEMPKRRALTTAVNTQFHRGPAAETHVDDDVNESYVRPS